MENRATITIDAVTLTAFPHRQEDARRGVDILSELQENLQNKGDDPEYRRVVFAGDQSQGFRVVTERDVRLAGVFPRSSSTRYHYEGKTIPNLFSIKKDTLVVAPNSDIAMQWENELRALGYDIRRI